MELVAQSLPIGKDLTLKEYTSKAYKPNYELC